MVRSDFGISSCSNSKRNEGTAIATRISTGTMVQITSINVLWVVLEGTGLALALNLTITTISRTITKMVIELMIQSRKL